MFSQWKHITAACKYSFAMESPLINQEFTNTVNGLRRTGKAFKN